MSSPVEVFNRCSLPSLDSAYTEAGPPAKALPLCAPAGAGTGAGPPGAAAPPRAGGGIVGIAVNPPGHLQEEVVTCGSRVEYSRCFCQKIVPRSASIA